jgi:hypothetical protein
VSRGQLVLLGRALAAILLIAALCVGAVTSIRSLHDARTDVHRADARPRINGRLPLLGGPRDQFVDFVAGVVPPNASIRILQPLTKRAPARAPAPGPAGVCGNDVNLAAYWIFVYSLAPRPSVCDTSGSWTVYLGVPVPPGTGVHRYSATLGVRAP